MRGLEESIISRGVRLVIMDSVASLARKEFNSTSLVERTEVLATQAAILKYATASRSLVAMVAAD